MTEESDWYMSHRHCHCRERRLDLGKFLFMKIVLINDTDGRSNIGCRLTSSELKRQLIAHFAMAGITANISSLPWRFGEGAKHCQAWLKALHFSICCTSKMKNRQFVKWLRFLARQEYGQAAITETINADMAIFQPEGTVSDENGLDKIIYLFSLPLLALHQGIPVLLINGTFPLFNDKRGEMIKSLLNHFDYVALRDRLSAEHYNTKFMPDAAIMWQHANMADFDSRNREYLLISTGAHFKKEEDCMLAKKALLFCEENGLKPLVLTKQCKHLYEFRDQVKSAGGEFIENATLSEATAWVSQCKLHIGGRYHMTILGITQDVPSVVMLTNTHKNRWLTRDFPGVIMADTFDEIALKAQNLARNYRTQVPELSKKREKVRSVFRSEMTCLVNVAENIYRNNEDRQVTISSLESIYNYISFKIIVVTIMEQVRLKSQKPLSIYKSILRALARMKNKLCRAES